MYIGVLLLKFLSRYKQISPSELTWPRCALVIWTTIYVFFLILVKFHHIKIWEYYDWIYNVDLDKMQTKIKEWNCNTSSCLTVNINKIWQWSWSTIIIDATATDCATLNCPIFFVFFIRNDLTFISLNRAHSFSPSLSHSFVCLKWSSTNHNKIPKLFTIHGQQQWILVCFLIVWLDCLHAQTQMRCTCSFTILQIVTYSSNVTLKKY